MADPFYFLLRGESRGDRQVDRWIQRQRERERERGKMSREKNVEGEKVRSENVQRKRSQQKDVSEDLSLERKRIRCQEKEMSRKRNSK